MEPSKETPTEFEIERLQAHLREKEDNYQTLLDDAIVMREQLAASQREVERLKKDPLCQALTDHDCCCHSCLKDEAIAQMIKTERERDRLQAENAALKEQINELYKQMSRM